MKDGITFEKRLLKEDEIAAIKKSCRGAYKDVDVVMNNQRDLVEIVHTLKQVMCVKGN